MVHGIPEVVKTDNGPPFQSEDFANFAKYLNLTPQRITPLWPEANGEAERFMRTLKKAVQTAETDGRSWRQSLWTFLCNYRATPHTTTLPQLSSTLTPSQTLHNNITQKTGRLYA